MLSVEQSLWAQLGVPLSAPVPLNQTAFSDVGQDRNADIAIDDQNRWVAVWESSTNLNSSGTDYDIQFSRSVDGGLTWSAPALLNSNATEDGLAVDRDPRIVFDQSSGLFIVTWMSHSIPGGGVGIDFDIHFSVSDDGGQTWSDQELVNINGGSDKGHDFDPMIAVDGAGLWVAVWRTRDSLVGTVGPDAEIAFSRRAGLAGSWSPPLPLNSNALDDEGHDVLPQLAYRNGVWVCVWHANKNFGNDYDIVYSRSVDGGQTWSAIAPLHASFTNDAGEDDNAHIYVDAVGTWIAVWSSTNSMGGLLGNDRDLLVARSFNGGATWSSPAPLLLSFANDGGEDNEPRLACDSQGNWICAWQSTSTLGGTIGSDLDILISKSTNNGLTWSSPLAANTNAAIDSGADESPRVARDIAGGWLAVWKSHDTLGSTIGIDADVLNARFALPDCNGNTIPDSTEPDLNRNGMPDNCEPLSCPGDIAPIGGNGAVNVDDLLSVIGSWGSCGSTCIADIAPVGPPTGNGIVNVDDLLVVISNWGPCE